jgi:uncharacterized C2H2 Zn-finger protein
MAVSLIKIVDGKPAVSDSLTNELVMECPSCDQVYRLGYSDTERNLVKDWLAIAERAIREEHKLKHSAASLSIEWKPARRKR